MEITKDSWLENDGHVRCWLAKNPKALRSKVTYLKGQGYFCVITPKKFSGVGEVAVLKASRIAAFIVPRLAIHRNEIETIKAKQGYKLSRALLLDNKDAEWRVTTREWCEEEEQTVELTDNVIRFLRLKFQGTFTELPPS